MLKALVGHIAMSSARALMPVLLIRFQVNRTRLQVDETKDLESFLPPPHSMTEQQACEKPWYMNSSMPVDNLLSPAGFDMTWGIMSGTVSFKSLANDDSDRNRSGKWVENMTARLRHMSRRFVVLKRILEPQYVLLGVTLIHFLSTLVIVLGQKGNVFIVDQWGFFLRAMAYPLLLLFSCFLILTGRLGTIGLAMMIASSLFYILGYRGLFGVSYAHDVDAISVTALRIWLDVTPTNLVVQTVLAAVILLFGTVQFLHLLQKSRKPLS